MKKTGRPSVLALNGKAAACRQADSRFDAVASIRRGLRQAEKGMGRPVDDVFDELERVTERY